MLEIQLDIAGYASDTRLFGEVWNVHQVAAAADYDFWFHGRRKPPTALLKSYPRWCEPVSGLFARCLALTRTTAPTHRVAPWKFFRVRLGIRPGGSGDYVRTEKTRPPQLQITLLKFKIRHADNVRAVCVQFGPRLKTFLRHDEADVGPGFRHHGRERMDDRFWDGGRPVLAFHDVLDPVHRRLVHCIDIYLDYAPWRCQHLLGLR